LIKLNDPIGTAIKLEEYYEVFANDFHPFFMSLIPLALSFSIFLNVLEVVLGVAVLINYKMKTISWILLVMIVFFSFLTFYSAYFNKVTDCGCFGDAIKLKPWESFIKDMVLLVFVWVLFTYRNSAKPVLSELWGNLSIGALTMSCCFIAYYVIQHLSFIDFRPYKIGANIPTLMKTSAPIRYAYNMEKDGKIVRMEQYPSDTTYKFKSMDVLNPEDLPKITDYSIWNDNGNYTQETFVGKKLLVLIIYVEKAETKNMAALRGLLNDLKNTDIQPIIVTSSDYQAFENFRMEHQLSVPYYYGDATVLKTIIRSNPGLMLLQDGTVMGKWHNNDTPSADQIKALVNSK
ncbi:MAG: DoxX family protein, partial [Cytophagales bacterium]|nr:DoxX family protein [Cytophagales bacterium]